jgi:hypothetical protein
MQTQATKKMYEIKSCGKERGGSFGGKLPPVAGSYGGMPPTKTNRSQYTESKSNLRKFVPHLGDFRECHIFEL